MDTSKIYMKMCERAEEIQKLWNPKEGDFTAFDLEDTPFIAYDDERDLIHGSIWLLRQDELQDMMECGFRAAICKLYEFITSFSTIEYSSKFTSMEQICLALVMKERYEKTWNGEDWVK